MFFLKRLAVLGIVFIFHISCDNGSEKKLHVKEIVIDNTAVTDVTDITDQIDTITIVPLNETPGNYLGSIFKVYFGNDKYVVFDRMQTKKINLFDKDGNFIKTIIRPGHGPNEALQINDCWVNYKGELEVYDFAQKKVYQFDTLFNLRKIVSGDKKYIFKSMMRIPNSSNYIAYGTYDERNRFGNGDRFHVALLDSNLSFVHGFLPFDKEFDGIEWLSFKQHFYVYNDSIRFTQALDNYIYELKANKLQEKYKIVYKEDPLPDDILDKKVRPNLEVFKNRESPPGEKSAFFKDYAVFTGTWLETEEYIYLTSRQRVEYGYFTLLNKKTLQPEFSSKALSVQKGYNFRLPHLEFSDITANKLIGVTNGSDLKKSLLPNSKLHDLIKPDPSLIYIVNVMFKK